MTHNEAVDGVRSMIKGSSDCDEVNNEKQETDRKTSIHICLCCS